MLFDLPRPIIFAHRGASLHAPENTLAAFRLAIQQEAPAIELDVKLSADRQVVVFHDFDVQRTTDGQGKIADLTLEELRRLDAGSHFDIAFRGERIPTLAEVFDLCAGQVFINIELTNYNTPSDGLASVVASMVKSAGLQDQVMFSSFFPNNLLTTRRILPDVPVGLLAWGGIKGWLARSRFIAAVFPYQALHPALEDVSPELVKQVHARKRLVNVYTVNEPDDLTRLTRMGVDGFFTDDPVLARQSIQSEKLT